MPVTVKCAWCGKEKQVHDFQARRQDKFFCNTTCSGKFRTANTVKVTCAFCGKEKQVPEYVAKRSVRFYCNRFCLGKYKSAHAKKVEVTCEECGKKVLRWPHEAERVEKTFCSRKCSAKYRANNRVIVKCDWCGKDVYYPKSHVSRSEKHFCDKYCMAAWKSANERGENNHYCYSKVKVNCVICGKEIEKKKSHVKKIHNHFCGLNCKMEYYKSSAFREFCRKQMLNILSTYPRRTKPERYVKNLLDTLGIQYDEQVIISNKFCVDFLVGRLVIEVFGDYFHANPLKYGEGLKPLDKLQKKNVLNDSRKIKYLEKCGYKVLIIWEHEIEQESLLVKQKLKQYCKEAT